jgi:hypothetical protein
MEIYLVSGPDDPHARSRLVERLIGSGFVLVPKGEIIYSDRLLRDTLLGKQFYARDLLDALERQGLRTVADMQRLGVLQAWREVRRALPTKRGESGPFIELCRSMTMEALSFADNVPAAGLLMTEADWARRYGIDTHVARVLVTNSVGGPDLLVRMDDTDIRNMWQCGIKMAPTIIGLRDELRQP